MTQYLEEKKQRLQESLNIEVEDSNTLYRVETRDNQTAQLFIYGLLIGLTILFYALFSLSRVDGRSMNPTLHEGQFILVSKTEKVDRFDVAVLKERETKGGPTKLIVKRIIGLPGDTVTVLNGELFINDKLYEEDYLDEENIKNWKTQSFTIKVPKHHYFVLGDNRDVSKDSRHVGNFVDSSVIGVKMFE